MLDLGGGVLELGLRFDGPDGADEAAVAPAVEVALVQLEELRAELQLARNAAVLRLVLGRV